MVYSAHGIILAALCCAASVWAQTGAPAAAVEPIGRLSGDDVTVSGAMSFDTDNGRSTAVLASGSDIIVRTGQAKIDLIGGGDIAICGPAHLSLLKSGGAITVALDYGRVHPEIASALPITIYTPLIIATPVAIGQGERDLTIGLDRNNEMCAVASSGALRIEQQFSGQSLLVPQGGEVDLNGGELSTLHQSSSGCSCDLSVAHSVAPKQLDFGVALHPSETQPTKAAKNPPVAAAAPQPVDTATDRPTVRIDMPPLTFDSASPAPPPDPDPSTLLLVRESRLEPEVVFQGHVEAVPAVPAKSPAATAGTEQKKRGIFARFFGLFHRHKAASACAGSSCSPAA